MPYIENYHPDVMAFGLKTRKPFVIAGANLAGIVLPDLAPGTPYLGPYGGAFWVYGADGSKHLGFMVDTNGQGKYQADILGLNNLYIGAGREIHLRPFLNIGETDDRLGRTLVSSDEESNYILSAGNYQGNTSKHLIIGKYNGPGEDYTQHIKIDKTTGRAALNALTVSSPSPPASASATGVAGQIEWDANYVYVCVATNTWKRVALSTW